MVWKPLFASATATIAFASTACTASRVSPTMPAIANASRTSSATSFTAGASVLHSFGGPDGAAPAFGVNSDKSHAFYGTTIFGGSASHGAVFKLAPRGSGYREEVIYSFKGGLDGDSPFGSLVMDRSGALYGSTTFGGFYNGTVFKLTPKRSHYTETVLYRFGNPPDAGQSVGTLVMDRYGNLFGATQFGGSANLGAVFELTPSGSGYKESVLYSFPGRTGGYVPQGGIAIDTAGNLYGTVFGGGDLTKCAQAGCGLVFKLTRKGSEYSESVIYDFQGSPTDGSNPQGTVTVDERTGAVYGTAQGGANNGGGIVYKLVRLGSAYRETILHNFNFHTDGLDPQGAVLVKADGTVFGTSEFGGGGCRGIGCGNVFEIVPSGSTYTFHVLYEFSKPLNGADPENTTLITDASGALYGTTRSGGTKTQCSDGGPGGALGCGVVFKLVHPI